METPYIDKTIVRAYEIAKELGFDDLDSCLEYLEKK